MAQPRFIPVSDPGGIPEADRYTVGAGVTPPTPQQSTPTTGTAGAPVVSSTNPFAMNQVGLGEQEILNNQGFFDAPTELGQQWDAQGANYNDPMAGEQYNTQIQGQYGPGGPDQSQTAWQDYQGAGLEAGLDPYYDRQRDEASARIQQQLAAQGLGGSSYGGRQISDAMVALGAEQADREAQFDLDRLGLGGRLGQAAAGQETQWVNAMGNIAGQAGQEEIQRLGGGLEGAQATDTGALERVGFGIDAMMAAERERGGRAQQYLDNIYNTSFPLYESSLGYGEGSVEQDQAYQDAIAGGKLASATEQANAALQQQEEQRRNVADIMDTVSWGTSGGQKGGLDDTEGAAGSAAPKK